jgi:putative endonuclease
MYFVYILESINYDRIYIGSTGDVKKRLQRHNDGLVSSTKSYRPWNLLGLEEFKTLGEARKKEYYLKSLKKPDYIKRIFGKKKD